MKTIILCGGRGTRLKEETEFKPKPIIPIGGKPILWHIMKIYSTFGYNDFIFCLGYKGDMIKNYFLNYRSLVNDFTLKINSGDIDHFYNNKEINDFRITFADTGEETLTAERIKMVQKYVEEDNFMVTYGDGVANIDIEKLIDFHNRQNVIGTITCVHPHSKYGLVAIDDKFLVTSFDQKPKLFDYINGGFMIFKKDFFNFLQKGQMLEDALVELVKKKQLASYVHEDFWHCMDTYKDVEDLNDMWIKNPQWKMW